MIQGLSWFVVSILVESVSPIPGLAVVLGGLLAWTFSHEKKPWIMLLFLIYFGRVLISTPSDVLHEGRVVELNASSVIVMEGFTKALVTGLDPSTVSLGDRLSLENCSEYRVPESRFGFNGKAWAQAQSISQSCQGEALLKSSHPILQWLSGTDLEITFQGFWRTLILQSSHVDALAWLVSFGLIFQLLFKVLDKTLGRWLHPRIQWMCKALLFGLLGYGLGWPLALTRLVVQRGLNQFTKDPRLRWLITLVCLGFINPKGFTQLSWALPLALAYLNSFKPVLKSWFGQSLMVVTVFLGFGIPIHLFQLGLFRWIRKSYPWMVGLLVVSRFSLSFQKLWGLGLIYIQSFELKAGWLTGQLSLLSILALMFVLGGFLKGSSRVLTVLWISILVILNPLTHIPLLSQVTFINVGQGDSILIQTAFNQDVILIDTGPKTSLNHVVSVLRGLGLQKLDNLIVTHADHDHSANTEDLIELFHPMVMDEAHSMSLYRGELTYFPLDGMPSENDASWVYRLQVEDVSVCLMADVSTFAEVQLIKRYPDFSCSILKVGHHGSNTSSSLRFLNTINAHIALISVGRNNYGHPSYEVIQRLKDLHMDSLSTLNEGDIQFYVSPWFTIVRTHVFSFRFYLS